MSNNLTLTMKYFGELTADERDLFLKVVASTPVKAVEKPKRKKKELPYIYSEEYFYETLKAGWNEGVRKRKANAEAKAKREKYKNKD